MKRFAIISLFALLTAASSASAAVEYGTTPSPITTFAPACQIPDGANARSCTVVQTFAGGSNQKPGGLVIAEPGIVTSWSIDHGDAGAATMQITPHFFAAAPVGGFTQYSGVSIGTQRVIPEGIGTATFPDRIPVSPGQHLGFDIELTSGLPGNAAYVVAATTLAGFANLNPKVPVDGVFNSPTSTDMGQKVVGSVVVEPDADGDGYGDETQDLCPARADLQIACPATNPPLIPPQLSAVKVTKKFRLTFTSSQQGTGSFTVSRKTGRKFRKVKTIDISVAAGKNEVALKPALGGKRLKPGLYRIKMTIRNAANLAAAETTSFRVKKRKRR